MTEPVVNERERQNAQALERARVPIRPAWYKGNELFSLFMHSSSLAIPEAERLVIHTVEEVEHFTATMAKQVLDTGIFEGRNVDERMDRVWTWHAIEELDHRSTVYDIYLALGGGYLRRAWAALLMGVIFLFLLSPCLPSLLRQRKILWSAPIWKKGLPMLFGTRGVYRHVTLYWLLLFKPSFHPTSIPISNRLQKQLRHYHIESELVAYFRDAR